MYYFLPNSLGNAAPLAAAGHLRSLAPPHASSKLPGAPHTPRCAPPGERPARRATHQAPRATSPRLPRTVPLPSRRPAAWSEPAGAEERKCRPRGTEPAVPRFLPRSTQDARGRGHGTPGGDVRSRLPCARARGGAPLGGRRSYPERRGRGACQAREPRAPRAPSWRGRAPGWTRTRCPQGPPGGRVYADREAESIPSCEGKKPASVPRARGAPGPGSAQRPARGGCGSRAGAQPRAAAATHLAVGAEDPGGAGAAVAGLPRGGRGLGRRARGAHAPVPAGLRGARPGRGQGRGGQRAGAAAAAGPGREQQQQQQQGGRGQQLRAGRRGAAGPHGRPRGRRGGRGSRSRSRSRHWGAVAAGRAAAAAAKAAPRGL